MFKEYRVAYEIIESFYGEEIHIKNKINLAYIIFHNGVGELSNLLSESILINYDRLDELINIFNAISNSHNRDIMRYKIKYGFDVGVNLCSDLDYKPFDGHTTRLGQYFRNLFHLLSYTNDIDETVISKREKYELIKSLRSQLSSYEQILIYLNSMSLYGLPLKEKGFIEQYCLIKNIPIPLTEFAGDIHEFYPRIQFEWDEILDRSSRYQ